MVAADKAGIAAINRYKEEMKTKGANKEKPQKPKALFRVHPARTSNAQFIQDMVNAVEVVDGTEMQLHMLTFDTELDNTMTVQKGGSVLELYLHGHTYGPEEEGACTEFWFWSCYTPDVYSAAFYELRNDGA